MDSPIITRPLDSENEARPRGRVMVNLTSIWITRWTRSKYSWGIHPAGAWTPRTRTYATTPHRANLLFTLAGDQLTNGDVLACMRVIGGWKPRQRKERAA